MHFDVLRSAGEETSLGTIARADARFEGRGSRGGESFAFRHKIDFPKPNLF